MTWKEYEEWSKQQDLIAYILIGFMILFVFLGPVILVEAAKNNESKIETVDTTGKKCSLCGTYNCKR